MDVRFKPATTHFVVGPSGSGKTHHVLSIIEKKDDLIVNGKNVKNIVFCYSRWQNIYTSFQNKNIIHKWINKLPTNQEFINYVEEYEDQGGSIVIIDDFMAQMSRDLVEIVTVSSRHTNTSTFILFQSLFPSNRLAREISLNVKYIHILKNPRENAQIQFLARQISPNEYKWIVDAYHEATKQPYSCFIIDLMQETPDEIRYRSNIFAKNSPISVWMPVSMNVRDYLRHEKKMQ